VCMKLFFIADEIKARDVIRHFFSFLSYGEGVKIGKYLGKNDDFETVCILHPSNILLRVGRGGRMQTVSKGRGSEIYNFP
jgi:hypothetical protein